MAVNNIPNVIIACCILYNVCEILGDAFNELWIDDVQLDQPVPLATTASVLSAAESIRNTLVQYYNS